MQNIKPLEEIFDGSSLTCYELLEVFSNIVASGYANQHGGWYLEKAEELIEAGYLNNEGAILISRESLTRKVKVKGQ